MDFLIVEDDDRMSALLESGLKKEGHATTLATDGRDGFDLARTLRCHLLDVMLRAMDGLEVARRLRRPDAMAPSIRTADLGVT